MKTARKPDLRRQRNAEDPAQRDRPEDARTAMATTAAARRPARPRRERSAPRAGSAAASPARRRRRRPPRPRSAGAGRRRRTSSAARRRWRAGRTRARRACPAGAPAPARAVITSVQVSGSMRHGKATGTSCDRRVARGAAAFVGERERAGRGARPPPRRCARRSRTVRRRADRRRRRSAGDRRPPARRTRRAWRPARSRARSGTRRRRAAPPRTRPPTPVGRWRPASRAAPRRRPRGRGGTPATRIGCTQVRTRPRAAASRVASPIGSERVEELDLHLEAQHRGQAVAGVVGELRLPVRHARRAPACRSSRTASAAAGRGSTRAARSSSPFTAPESVCSAASSIGIATTLPGACGGSVGAAQVLVGGGEHLLAAVRRLHLEHHASGRGSSAPPVEPVGHRIVGDDGERALDGLAHRLHDALALGTIDVLGRDGAGLAPCWGRPCRRARSLPAVDRAAARRRERCRRNPRQGSMASATRMRDCFMTTSCLCCDVAVRSSSGRSVAAATPAITIHAKASPQRWYGVRACDARTVALRT